MQINIEQVLSTLEEIKSEVCQFIDSKMENLDSLQVNIKEDSSPVTEIDLYISNCFKERFKNLYPKLNFYSEEDKEELQYPTIIIDPIDGTRELARGVGECSISFGIYFSSTFNDPRNFSWIFNPFNSLTAQTNSKSINSRLVKRKRLLGFVSNTEFNNGLYDDLSSDITVIPKGSIAYKLGLLSKGICDFVITKKPKNIWDIMAGSHICAQLDLITFIDEKEVDRIDDELINAPILWCRRENLENLRKEFQI